MADKPRLTAVGAGEAPPPPPRTVSTVAFPYADLAETEKAVGHVAGAGGRCLPEQLAAWLGHSKLDSGAFRNKVAAAKLFGVLEGGRRSLLLTDLGRRLADPESVRQARVEAFLAVPLYRSLFENHRGNKMPGVMGLELEMLRFGVSRTQVKAARQVFLRSAEKAGLFEAGAHQMVLPKGTFIPPAAGEESQQVPGRPYPKVIEGLLEEAPWNEEWTEQAFDRWAGLLVDAARMHFKLPPEGSGS
ncbi:MAG TPA: hypothetical protein VHI31_06745 [Actinomycetota bacterium]|nr:hypothetical protein [Actinomycetota bacterium]